MERLIRTGFARQADTISGQAYVPLSQVDHRTGHTRPCAT